MFLPEYNMMKLAEQRHEALLETAGRGEVGISRLVGRLRRKLGTFLIRMGGHIAGIGDMPAYEKLMKYSALAGKGRFIG
ncbi:hypothetical protein [Salinispira pacifica]|uniref:Uncharacterized protein n=1 Tax=Salinispira pacifica TaxID=1307761 RepID=V5WM01_9SPIO|nr:hypothetical protein [Salinispira pacifica]AHC16126.1 hypothetical protein L21SP2_2776 [Salinispira pacifica]